MKKFISKFLVVNLMIATILGINNLTFAEGNGNGTGGGQGKALQVETISIEPGAKDLPTDLQIDLVFNKNVVNSKVKEENIKTFTLADSTGQNVDVEVIMADDQVEPDKRNNVSIKPKEELKSGEEYTLTIDKSIVSKSGETMKDNKVVTFSTKEKLQATPVNEETKDSNDNKVSIEKYNTQEDSKESLNPFIIIGSIAVVVAGLYFMVSRKKK